MNSYGSDFRIETLNPDPSRKNNLSSRFNLNVSQRSSSHVRKVDGGSYFEENALDSELTYGITC